MDNIATVFDVTNNARKPEKASIDLSQVNHLYRISFSVKNDLGKDTVFYLRSKGNGISALTVTDTLGNRIQAQKTGYSLPINQRFGNDDVGFLPFNIPKNTTVNAQLDVEGFVAEKPNLHVAVFSPEAYYKFYKDNGPIANTHEYLVVFFMGAMFLMLMFFLFMYIKSNQRLYGIYALYLGLQWLCSFFELGANTLVGSFTLRAPLLIATLDETLVLSAIGAYLLFANTLLELESQNKRLYLMMKWLAYGLWVYSFIHWFTFYNWPKYEYRQTTDILVRFFLISFSLYVLTVVALKIKSNIKSYFIAGSSLFVLFSIISIIKGKIGLTGYITRLSDTNWYNMGILCECFFFAFALGIRIKELRLEKDVSRRKLIVQMQLNEQLMKQDKRELEHKVAERTARMLLQEKEIEAIKLQETKAAYERQISETRMLALRSRMNPHFLFNSLNSIKYFILKNDNDTAAFYLNKFSRLLRMILDYTSHESITLQQELQALELYLEIESLRFDKSFHYHIRVDENVVPEMINIPPLLLQPFVENAIWHGLANSEKTDKQCSIEVTKKNGRILIQIIDNGVGRKAAAIFKENKLNNITSHGIKITEERMDIYNQANEKRLSINVKDNKDEDKNPIGTTVNIAIVSREA